MTESLSIEEKRQQHHALAEIRPAGWAALGASVLAWVEEAEAAFGCHEDGLVAPVPKIAQRIAHSTPPSFWAAQQHTKLLSG